MQASVAAPERSGGRRDRACTGSTSRTREHNRRLNVLSIGKPRPLTVGSDEGREAAEEDTDRVGRRRRSRPTARFGAPNKHWLIK